MPCCKPPAARPCSSAGGLVLSGAREEFLELCGRLQIPVLSTWRAKDVLPHDDPLYFGMPGIPAPRYANYILQNCDFLLILGHAPESRAYGL